MAEKNDTKIKALSEMMKKINKEKGSGTVRFLSEETSLKVPTISSGSLLLDKIMGGGFPRGRITEVYGVEGGGKSTLALLACAEAQKTGGTVAYIDMEQAVNFEWAKKLGVHFDESFIFVQPDSAESAGDIMKAFISSGVVDILILDSIASMIPQQELDGVMEDQQMGLQARVMGKIVRNIVPIAAKSKCAVIMINQLREKIGVMFGNPETTPGGKAVKYAATVRLDVRRGDVIKDGANVIGHKMKVKTVKNKIAPPSRMVEIPLLYESGFDSVGEIISVAVDADIINKSGSWYSYNDQKLGQGENAVRAALMNDNNLFEEIKNKVVNMSLDASADDYKNMPM